jgi:phosphatidylethanolamine-binding protein (PEBP) family uncharacterized protein
MLDLPEGTELDELTAAMTGHVLAETELVGMYKRI